MGQKFALPLTNFGFLGFPGPGKPALQKLACEKPIWQRYAGRTQICAHKHGAACKGYDALVGYYAISY
jgi:hypothetical protein